MQSQWHNTPTINGVQQKDGGQYKAANVSYKSVSNKPVFEANIAGAYPTDAHVKEWVRKLTFDRNATSISLSETYKLDKFVKPFELNFVTILDADLKDKSTGTVVLKNKSTKLVMKFDKNQFDVRVDQHKTDDHKLTDEWGLYINRVVLVSKEKAVEGKHDVVFHL